MVSKTNPQRAIKLHTAEIKLSPVLHPSALHTESYLIQLPRQGSNLPGVGKSNVQAGRDCIDELNVMLFSC